MEVKVGKKVLPSKLNLLCTTLLFGILTVPQISYATSAGEVKDTSKKAIQIGITSQHAHESWVEEEHRLLEEIEDLENLIDHIQWQQKKFAVYKDDLQKKIAELNEKAKAMETVNMQLLPILEENLEKIQANIAEDIPGNLTERHKSIHHARMILNDYDMGLLDKARVVLDAVAREVDLGHQVNVLEDEIEVEDQLRRVKMLQVGRVGLYAMTLDNSRAYQWNPATSQWTIIDAADSIRDAIDMAEGVRLVGLNKLPVTQPQQEKGARQ